MSRINILALEWWASEDDSDPNRPKNAVFQIAKKFDEGRTRYIKSHGLENTLRNIAQEAQGRQIGTLDLIGHGRPGAFSFGAELGARDRARFPRAKGPDSLTGLLEADESIAQSFRWLRDLGIIDELTTIRVLGCVTAIGSDAGNGQLLLGAITSAAKCQIRGTRTYLGPEDFTKDGLSRHAAEQLVSGPSWPRNFQYELDGDYDETRSLSDWVASVAGDDFAKNFEQAPLKWTPLHLSDGQTSLEPTISVVAAGLLIRASKDGVTRYFPRKKAAAATENAASPSQT